MTENQSGGTLIHVKPGDSGELSTYDIAKQALSLAVTVDEAKSIHDDAERMAFYARQANDKDLIADAMALVLRSRRRLGELLIKAKERGQLSLGGRPRKDGAARGDAAQRVTLKEAGIDWKLSSEAQKLAGYEEDDFEAVIEKGREKIRSGGAVVINPVKDLNTKEKQLHRDIREAQLAARQKALPEKKYGVIYADPEWAFEVWSEAGKDRAADNHYPTSALAIIEARPVETIAADDCVLFLWVTSPHHAAGNGAMIMRAWGFTPKAEYIWDKGEAGTGFWNRNRHEILLVGTRGNVPAPALGTQWPSLISSPKGAHSEKPDWGYELIEDYFPNLPKIELNARARRDGWDAWGYEAPEDEDRPISSMQGGAPVAREAHNLEVAGSIPAPATSFSADAERPRLDVRGVDGGSLAADAETGAAAAMAAPGVGEGAGFEKKAPGTLPDSPVLGVEAQNDILRTGMAKVPPTPIAELMALTGLTRDQVKKRNQKLGIASRDNQRAAARASITQFNQDRRAGA